MTAYTQSGYPVITEYGDRRIVPLVVASVPFPPGVLAGDVHTVLAYVAQRFHDTVTPLKPGQCWGFAPRNIRGGTGYSNHAGGVAIDCNSAQFPQYRATMTAKQRAACRAIVKACDGVVRWGGDFTAGSLDEMHFEIAPGKSGAPVAALAKKLADQEDIMPSLTKAELRKLVRTQTRAGLINKKGRLRAAVRRALEPLIRAIVKEELTK